MKRNIKSYANIYKPTWIHPGMASEQRPTRLKRHLSLADLLFIGIAGSIGGAIFYGAQKVAANAGPAGILAYTLAVSPEAVGVSPPSPSRRSPRAPSPQWLPNGRPRFPATTDLGNPG